MKRLTVTIAALLLLVGASARAADGVSELQQAYQKEFTFLAEQEKVLREQIARFSKESKLAETRARIEVDQLEEKLLLVQGQAVALEERVAEAERRAEANRGNSQLLEATFEQALASLEEYGRAPALAPDASDLDKLAAIFAAANSTTTGMASIRRETGRFFLGDGTEVEGRLIRVGQIAAYGISDRGTGVLAPAGGGQLKLWRAPAQEVALALEQGGSAPLMKLFLFESLNADYSENEEKGVVDVINDGGTIGWIIVALGGLALVMIGLRIAFLRAASSSTDALMERITGLVREGKVEQAMEACRERPSATSRVVVATLRNLDRDRDHIEDIVAESVLHESGHLDRFGAFILVLAAVSPLLGLLGTVTGMISTFDIITEFGTGDPKLLSSGISIALVTTELGLVVAIPTLLVGNLLSGWAERIKHEMEQAALRVINVRLVAA